MTVFISDTIWPYIAYPGFVKKWFVSSPDIFVKCCPRMGSDDGYHHSDSYYGFGAIVQLKYFKPVDCMPAIKSGRDVSRGGEHAGRALPPSRKIN